MLRVGSVAWLSVLLLTAAVAQTATPEQAPVKSEDEVVKLREEVERLHRTLEKQREDAERQIDGVKRSLEAKLAGLANGMDAVRISVDAVRNAVGSMQLPKRPPITIAADSSAPIVCGPMGCEATALDHCRKSGYEIAHVVHKLEKPVQWLYTFVCRDG